MVCCLERCTVAAPRFTYRPDASRGSYIEAFFLGGGTGEFAAFPAGILVRVGRLCGGWWIDNVCFGTGSAFPRINLFFNFIF